MEKISVGGVVYFTVLCDHPCLVSLFFAVLVSLHPVTFSNVFYYLYIICFLPVECKTQISALDCSALCSELTLSCPADGEAQTYVIPECYVAVEVEASEAVMELCHL